MLIKVIVVDDHDIVSAGIKRLLSDVDGVSVVGTASNGEEAVQLVKEQQPHVILMDVRMPGIGGLEAIKKILHNSPTVKIIALTACVEEPYPSKLLQAGVVGYLTKEAGLEEMVLAIKTVYAGKNYISLDVAQKLALKSVKGEGSPMDQLSERELQVMMMIINGQKPQVISDILCLSPKTVNSYRYRVFDKLGVTNDVELTHFAIRYGILESLETN